MDLTSGGEVGQALALVGELLAAEGHTYAIVILGGAALNLLGTVERATADVDILAFAEPQASKAPDESSIREPPRHMPEPLAHAARAVAHDLGLDPDWLNTGPSLQWRVGLPPGLEGRVQWRQYTALWVGIVSRYDLIFFKLFAAADSVGTRSVHYQDLLALRPTSADLDAAAKWVARQDASSEFSRVLDRVLNHVQHDLSLA